MSFSVTSLLRPGQLALVLEMVASGRRTGLDLPAGYTPALVILKGAVPVNDSEAISSAEVGLFDRPGQHISIQCMDDARALLLCGQPIDEPIVGQGPFVMNTAREIRQALEDYGSGRLGHLG